MAILQVANGGDSTGQGTTGGFDRLHGGQGSWTEIAADVLSPYYGPIISPGCKFLFPENEGDVWTEAGSWSTTVSTDAFDKLPYGLAVYSAAGSSATRTFTKPAGMGPIVGFQPLYIDYASAGDWQYRIDGGTWTNMGQTVAHDNGLKTFYVDLPVTSTVDFRAYNGASGVGLCLVGLWPFYTDPHDVTDGLIWHNVARGAEYIDSLCKTTSGDRPAFFDEVVAGTGDPLLPAIDVLVGGPYTNDAFLLAGGTVPQWEANWDTFWARLPDAARFYVGNFEQNPSARSAATQDTYRDAATARAVADGVEGSLNMYDRWLTCHGTPDSTTQFSDANAAGMYTDNLHQSQVGHLDMGRRVGAEILAQLFDVLATIDPFEHSLSTYGTETVGGDLALPISDTDTASSTDALAAVGPTAADTAAAAEAELSIGLDATDTATGTDDPVEISFTDADLAAFIDTEALTADASSADTATFTEAASVFVAADPTGLGTWTVLSTLGTWDPERGLGTHTVESDLGSWDVEGDLGEHRVPVRIGIWNEAT